MLGFVWLYSIFERYDLFFEIKVGLHYAADFTTNRTVIFLFVYPRESCAFFADFVDGFALSAFYGYIVAHSWFFES